MTAAVHESVAPPSELHQLREAAKKHGFDHMTSGSWFQRMVATHIKGHATSIGASHWDRLFPGLDVEERAEKRVKSAMRRASMAGALASAGCSTGEVLSLLTDGIAAPIGLPAAVLSMFAEAAYTSRLQVDLACDLASIYGVPFDPDDLGEITTLFGLGLEVDVKAGAKGQHPEPAGVTATLLELEDGEVAKRIGRKLLEESVMRNIVPVIGIAISARWNYVATQRFAHTARKYVRYRRALRAACAKLRLASVADPGLLLQGAWLMATVDGDAGHEELLALALILESLQIGCKDAHLDETGDDEEEWFARLARAPLGLHDALLDVLYLVAATDRELQSSERRFLRRVGAVTGREIDLGRIERFCAHLADGDDVPDGFYHSSPPQK